MQKLTILEKLHRLTLPPVLMTGVAVVTFIVETLLVDRKFAVFSGGFGQSKIIDALGEWLCFLGGAVAMHALLFTMLYRILVWIHRKRPAGLLLRFNILCLAGAGFLGVLIGKFEVLSYFSDAVSFALIKSLGGGSIKQALLFGLYYGGFVVVGIGGAIAAYLVVLYWLAKRDPKLATIASPPVRWKQALITAVSVPALLYGANLSTDARYGNARYMAHNLAMTTLDQVTDFDRDGYSLFSSQIDDFPFNASRHPFALDIPNNGIDEDGVGGDLVIAPLPALMPTPQFKGARPNVIQVVFESMRGDVLGKRINGKPVAPNLEALAAGGSVRPAYSPVGFTAESVKAMFSGYTEPPFHSHSLFTDFKANGYRVGVFSGQAEHFGDIADALSSSDVADVFIDAEKLKDKRAYGHASLASVKLDERVLLDEFTARYGNAKMWTQPNFLYFNFQSAHFPYSHPGMKTLIEPNPIPRDEVGQANRAWVQSTYWNAVAQSDYALGLLIAELKQLGVYDNTILLVTGDHGEELFEHGFLGHGHILNRTQYQTVMVLSRPGYGGAAPIGLVDYRILVHHAVEGVPNPERAEPILLNIGALQAPGAIAMVDAHHEMTILHLDTKEVQIGENGSRIPLASVTGSAKRRVDQLITLWGRERWRHHLMHEAADKAGHGG
jgi:phosphoglycerol transferase MdoB-like AlkP superfamily enzyme